MLPAIVFHKRKSMAAEEINDHETMSKYRVNNERGPLPIWSSSEAAAWYSSFSQVTIFASLGYDGSISGKRVALKVAICEMAC